MRRWRILAIALWAAIMSAQGTNGQPARNSVAEPADGFGYKYAVTPQAGEWLICVQTFKDAKDCPPQAERLAQEMAELLMRDYKLPAYLLVRGRKERLEEEKRINEIRNRNNTMFQRMRADGLVPVGDLFTYRVPVNLIKEEFAVLIGKPKRQLKDIDAARDYLNDVHKLNAPPKEYCWGTFSADADPTGKTITQRKGVDYLNPFMTAMVVHNPACTEARKKLNDPTVADAFLKELNSGEKFSVLKCSKPWTLVVKVYQGSSVLTESKSTGIMGKLGFGKKDGELLNAAGMFAHGTAETLRAMKFDAYVMHQRQYSIVTIGQYDGQFDPKLLANQKSLAGLQLKDMKTGIVMETLNALPLGMQIPR